MGSTIYHGSRFEYQECLDCRSMYVSPMPDRETLEQMYGDDYGQFISLEETHSGGEGTSRVLDELRKIDAGTFLDYGCGGGFLIKEVASAGWRAFGVEFDRSATEKLRGRADSEVVSDLDEFPVGLQFDAVHMGDVIEHLTDVNAGMLGILERLKTGGTIIAQGPLEANFNLFLTGIRFKKILRNSDSSMPPYHVILATSAGQKELFARFGLEELAFDVSETAHPAPEKFGAADLRNARLTALFILRRVSQAISPLLSSSSGNRYFYVGRKN